MTRLAEIRARLEAATPGPWIVDDDIHQIVTAWRSSPQAVRTRDIVGITHADRTFIAHAPTDIAALLTIAEAAWALSLAETLEDGAMREADLWDALKALEGGAR